MDLGAGLGFVLGDGNPSGSHHSDGYFRMGRVGVCDGGHWLVVMKKIKSPGRAKAGNASPSSAIVVDFARCGF